MSKIITHSQRIIKNKRQVSGRISLNWITSLKSLNKIRSSLGKKYQNRWSSNIEREWYAFMTISIYILHGLIFSDKNNVVISWWYTGIRIGNCITIELKMLLCRCVKWWNFTYFTGEFSFMSVYIIKISLSFYNSHHNVIHYLCGTALILWNNMIMGDILNYVDVSNFFLQS